MKKVKLILFLSVLSNLLVAQNNIKFNKEYRTYTAKHRKQIKKTAKGGKL
ncbi:MAG TPA: hypothetical protein VNG53_08705 [Bacteroidia bacterium]|nr:hypothetical protein [Bacteroidia bacterium]